MAEIILTIVVEVVKCVAPSAYIQISHLREKKYTSNLQNLKTEVENLKSERASTQHKVDEAKRKGEEIEENVENWLARASNVIEETDNFTKDEATANKSCFKGMCPNLKTRRRLSKEAVRLKEAIVDVREAERFDSISYSVIPEDIRLVSSKDYEAFESRMPILRNILNALEDPDVNMVGIYGMGGIGKTMIAEEVARKVRIDKLFDRVVFVEVSYSQDIRKIQGEIADKLGLKFHEESEPGRANSLFKRIKEEKKILVILDNIWENLDLRVVGIPHGDDHKGCKVLLTARSVDTLSRKMDSQPNFPIGCLNEEEAWSLFKKMAGDYVQGSELKEVARDVAKECAGLPVSIVTVARALRNKRLFEWKDTLEQLRRPSSTNFKNIQPTAYKAIELSYNKLEGEELKNIFLLIGYTYVVSIDRLLMFCMGLDLFQGVNKMEVARARVRTLVHKLKASCLLLDHISKNEGFFSMHDVVRDVAISIASTEQNVFTETNEQVDGCREWTDECAMKLYTSIVLRDIKTNVLPEVVGCPQLKLCSISADLQESSSLTIPNNFFEKMIQVRVMEFTRMNLLLLPSSLCLLSNLRTLNLYYCKLQDICVIGNLKKLEMLCLRGCDIKQLPVEVGQLTWLKLLDLRDCIKLEVIPPNILSNLSHLEELCISRRSFRKWELEVEGVKNASLEELKHLPNLTSLELDIHDVNSLPRGLFLEKLERYRIRVGDRYWESTNIWCREFRLRLNNRTSLKDWLIVQLQGIEVLELRELQEQDVNYFADELVKVGSSHLKHLILKGCGDDRGPRHELKRQGESANDMQSDEVILEDNVNISNTLFIEKVALPKLENLELRSINVERIWQNQVVATSCGIQNLMHLTLYKCMNLRCLFSSTTVSNNSFFQLQHIKIEKCHVLEELIVVDNQEERRNNIAMFPRLQYLKMHDLEKLTSFWTGDIHILEFPSLKELWISQCPEFMVRFKKATNDLTKKVFPNLEQLIVDAKHIVSNKCLFSEDLLYKLKCLDVDLVDESSTILSLDDFLQRFHSPKVLQIDGINFLLPKEKVENGMEIIIRNANRCCDLNHILKKDSPSIMNNLVILCVMGCDHLINLVPSSTSFQNLTTLEVLYCYTLRNVLTSSMAKTLVRLREMKIESCEMMTEIVLADNDNDDDAAKDEVIVFSELKELTFSYLELLTSFCCGNCAFKFPSLERLVVDDCPNMKVFSRGELSAPKLHKVQLSRWDVEEHWTWECDLNTTIQKLNHKKESLLKKRREGLKSQKFPPPASGPNLNLQTKSESLAAMVAGVWSDDDSLQLEASTQFKKLLLNERNPPIEEVIQSAVVPRFVEFLVREDYPQLQFEAASVLSNIASGTSENIKVVIDHGAIPIFVKLLTSPSDYVRQSAVRALGNVAIDSPGCRDLVLSQGALIPLLAQLNEHATLPMLRIATWTLCNFCGGKPQPPFDQVRAALPVLAQLVDSNDEEVLSDACEALSSLSDGTNDKIQAVIEAGVCPRLVELLGHRSSSVLAPALWTVGNIVRAGDFQTQCIIKCGALPYLLGLLIHNREKMIMYDACWTISNITVRNREEIQAVIDAGLISPLLSVLQNAGFGIKEAAWAIVNAIRRGTHEQIKYLVREGCVKPICDLLLCPDPWTVTVCLEGLGNILDVGEAEKNMGTTFGDVNQYAQLVEEAEGLEKIENLKSHDNNEISKKAEDILEIYWCGRVVGSGR